MHLLSFDPHIDVFYDMLNLEHITYLKNIKSTHMNICQSISIVLLDKYNHCGFKYLTASLYSNILCWCVSDSYQYITKYSWSQIYIDSQWVVWYIYSHSSASALDFSATEAIPKNTGKINQYLAKTKHNKAWLVCIFFRHAVLRLSETMSEYTCIVQGVLPRRLPRVLYGVTSAVNHVL